MAGLISLFLLVTFYASGAAALMYQLVWQRYLFAGVGVDIDSVTLIVSTFMLGIGLGGALGGWLADRFPSHRIQWYAMAELLLCILGASSPMVLGLLPSLHQLGWGYGHISVLAMFVLLIPTVVMGTTLPMLTIEFDQSRSNVGVSVGMLYFVNTLGAASGAWLVSHVLFMFHGLAFTAFLAAVTNFACFICAVLAWQIQHRQIVKYEGMLA